MAQINPNDNNYNNLKMSSLFDRNNFNVAKRPTRLLEARLNSPKARQTKTRPGVQLNPVITIKNDYSPNNNPNEENEAGDNRNASLRNASSSRSLKEFSYFDWSKVKLYKEEYRVHEANPNNIFQANDLSLMRAVRAGSTQRALNLSSYDVLQQQSNELPQVVTIRFT